MRLRYESGRRRIQNDEDVSDAEKQLILEFLDANDPKRNTYSMPDKKTKKDGTLTRYAREVGRVARDLEPDLTEATAYDVNRLMDDYLNGDVEGIKPEGLSNGTVRNKQGPMRRFFMYHDDLGVNPEEINFAEQGYSTVDERDMFTPDEVKRLRDEAKRRGSRDECLVDLLLYTGQRRSALLNLRLKDVNEDDGVFYLNEDDGDLKGAKGKRPLLGALQSVRDWKRQHPTGEPDDYLITHKTRQTNRDNARVGDKLDPSTIYRQLQRIGDSAGVNKPVNAHNFRHYFVTVCKREYGMDSDTVKHLIGHTSDSRVMESTYAHLTDDDYIQDAEEKVGIREPDKESPLTPSVCDRCGEPLDGDWKSCPYCEYVYTPDAHDVQKQMDSKAKGSYKKTEPEDAETMDKIDALDALLEDPQLKAALLDRLGDADDS